MRIHLLLTSVCLIALGACGSSGSGSGGGDAGGGSGGAPHADAGSGGSMGSGGAAVDSKAGPDGSGPDQPSGGACVAAGGTCIDTGSCDFPTNPSLNNACGVGQICCVRGQDGGPADTSGSDAPPIVPDGKFACGMTSCDPKTSYCMGAVGGLGGDRYSCQPLPGDCAGHGTCTCVHLPMCPQCSEKDGAVTLKCPVG